MLAVFNNGASAMQRTQNPSAKAVSAARRQFKTAKRAIELALVEKRGNFDAAVEQWWLARNELEAAGAIEPAHVLVKRLSAAHA
jgi:hypothetical protein